MRLSPADAGLQADSTYRRITGLRREEVAALSGVSLAWYTHMEQGRPIRVSEQVLDSLARTLKLDTDERTYMYELAGQRPPDRSSPGSTETARVSPALHLILDQLDRFPAYLVSDRWDIVAWNRSAGELFGLVREGDAFSLNLVYRMFRRPDYRRLFANWESIAKALIAQFRSYYGKYPDDPWYRELVDRLMTESEEFAAWWPAHEVDGLSEGYKRVIHPVHGEMILDYNSFLVAEHQSMTLTVYSPRNNPF